MEQNHENSENQDFTQANFEAAVNERNQQAIQNQADLIRFETANKEAADRADKARQAIEAATSPNMITEVPDHLKAAPAEAPDVSPEPVIDRVPGSPQA